MKDVYGTYPGSKPKEFVYIHKSAGLDFEDSEMTYTNEDGDSIITFEDYIEYMSFLEMVLSIVLVHKFEKYAFDLDKEVLIQEEIKVPRILVGISVDDKHVVIDSGPKFIDKFVNDLHKN